MKQDIELDGHCSKFAHEITAGFTGLILGWETKILQATQHGQLKKKKTVCNTFDGKINIEIKDVEGRSEVENSVVCEIPHLSFQ